MAEDEQIEVAGVEDTLSVRAPEGLALLDEVKKYKGQKDFDAWTKVAGKALSIFQEQQDKVGEAQALMDIAEAQDLMNMYAEALETANKAVEASKDSYDEATEMEAHMLVAHVNVGALELANNTQQGVDNVPALHSQAVSAAKQALEIARNTRSDNAQANAMYLLSRAHLGGKREKEGERYATQAFRIFKGCSDLPMAAACKLSVAQVHFQIGKVEDSMAHAKEALSLCQRSRTPQGAEIGQQAASFLSSIYEASKANAAFLDEQGQEKEDLDYLVSGGGLTVSYCQRIPIRR